MPSLPAAQYNHREVMYAARQRRKLILHLASHGKSHKQIARLFRITKQRVGQILAEARRES